MYAKIRSWKQINDAQNATAAFMNYVILQGVFIDETISVRFMEAAVLMRKALVSRSMVERGLGGAPGQTDFWQLASQEMEPVESMVADLKHRVRDHLASISLPVLAT